jgi:hypothetical protein
MTNDLLLQTMTLTEDRPVLSSERAPTKTRPKLSNSNQYLVMSPILTDWLNVSRNVTLTLTMTN